MNARCGAILRRTIAERQLIGGEGQKPQKNSCFHKTMVMEKGAEYLRSVTWNSLKTLPSPQEKECQPFR
jgi:hypothetical protein